MESVGGHNADSGLTREACLARPSLWSPKIPLTFSEAVSFWPSGPIASRIAASALLFSGVSYAALHRLLPLQSRVRDPITDRVGDAVRVLYSSTPPPEAIWPIRKMTNSAGFTGARPISTTSWPASMTSGGFVSSSHLT